MTEQIEAVTRITGDLHRSAAELFFKMIRLPKGAEHPFFIVGSHFLNSFERRRLTRVLRRRKERSKCPYTLYWYGLATGRTGGIVGFWQWDDPGDTENAILIRARKKIWDENERMGVYPNVEDKHMEEWE